MTMISDNRESATTAWKNMGATYYPPVGTSHPTNAQQPSTPPPSSPPAKQGHLLSRFLGHSSPDSALGPFPAPSSPVMLRGDNRPRANSMGNVDMTTYGTKPLLSPAPASYRRTERSLSLSPLVNPNAIWNNGHHPAPHQHHQYHHLRNHSCPTVNVALMNGGIGELPHVPLLNGRIDPATTLATRSLRRPSFGTEAKKCEETAIQAERIRARNLEKEELKMDADQLRAVLKQERHRMSRFAGDLAKLKNTSVIYQAEAEMLEEGRINGLMRRVEALQLEKGRIIVELEQEEEMLTNTLQKKLDEVRREKEQLEKQIEQEHRQLSNLIKENKKLPKDKDHQQPRLEMDPLTETDEEDNVEEKETAA